MSPVQQEVHAHELQVVEGAVPVELDGVYMRTGPNPQFEPQGGVVMYAASNHNAPSRH
jgi:carotenoid cleavage dioxygenase-like enzyme